MKVDLAYGQGHLAVEFPEERTTVIEPAHKPGLTDERAAIVKALDNPIGAKPPRVTIRPTDRVCISFTDLTRATPNERIIPWLLEY
jgi:nickel-dependent lactate racemase